ncbi:hypothetical protein [Streptomyces hoynatensis]|uniref:Secreted protein n=1 Tax=Streptomyces hoynatensis TaxID=1141874 RepID=A0A3A9YF07_9ACTN|nr:hypothetical protein [Streptomyces hoynatensis]RKN35810.1 hypothetical protein D7294_30850 [Streptomyces hoynatensis]
MTLSRICAFTASVLLTAGTAIAATPGSEGTDQAPAAEEATPRAAFTRHQGTARQIPAGGLLDVSVSCPSGQVPTGGGGASQSGLIHLVTSAPTENGWGVVGRNTGTVPDQLIPWVVCTTP